MTATHERFALDPEEVADRKVRFARELVEYLLVSGLLLLIFRPLGILVALCWGIRLFRRSYRRMVEPRLRERFTEEALERTPERPRACGRQRRRRHRSREREAAPRDASAQRLLRGLGEDARSRDNLESARQAWSELAAPDGPSDGAPPARTPAPGERDLALASLVRDTAAAFETVAREQGVTLEVETDCEGRLHGHPDRIRRALFELLREAVRDAAAHDAAPGASRTRVQLQMGENLAGTEVWVRVRGPRPAPASAPDAADARLVHARRLAETHGGSFELAATRDGSRELLLSLPKPSLPQGADGEA